MKRSYNNFGAVCCRRRSGRLIWLLDLKKEAFLAKSVWKSKADFFRSRKCQCEKREKSFYEILYKYDTKKNDKILNSTNIIFGV